MTIVHKADPGVMRECWLIICDGKVYDWRNDKPAATAIAAQLIRQGRDARVECRSIPARKLVK